MKKSVTIEWKTFELVSNYAIRSPSLSITEKGRGHMESIKIRSSSIRWLWENLQLAARLSERDKLICTKDEGDKVLIIHRKSNPRGRFVDITLNPRSGHGQRVIIPKEENGLG